MGNFFDKIRNVLSKQPSRIKFPTETPYSQTGPGFYLSQVYGNQRLAASIYEQSLQATADRLQRLRDYDTMDITPLVSTALNVYADDATTHNDYDRVLTILSDNDQVQEELEYLFFDVLDIDFNSFYWIRSMCKYGDNFQLLNIEPGKGITGFITLPTSEIEREEAFDGDPNSVRFKWLAQTAGYFDEVQVTHFRLRGDDNYLPYGRSLLEAGRRSWKQMQLLEDAMLIYRVSRAAERRVFHLEVAGLPPEQVGNYVEQQRQRIRTEPLINPTNGDIDLRYRVSALTDDYWFAKRGEMMSTVETLPGASNLNDIEDVQFIEQHLITSLGVPKAFLQFSDDLEGKSSASKVDVRFARSIQKIQRIFISGLQRIAMIHLIAKGMKNDEVIDFEIKMQNPSAIMELGKLEIMEKRYEIYDKAVNVTKAISPTRGRLEILHLNDDDIKEDLKLKFRDAKINNQVKNLEEAPPPVPGAEGQPADATPPAEESTTPEPDKTDKMLDDMEEESNALKQPLGKPYTTISSQNQGDLNPTAGVSHLNKEYRKSTKNNEMLFEKMNLLEYFNIKK